MAEREKIENTNGSDGLKDVAPSSDIFSINLKGEYKSITDINWFNIPPFSVITGINGSGKTQLLKAIYIGLTGLEPNRVQKSSEDIKAIISGDNIKDTDVVYVEGEGLINDLSPTSIRQFQKASDQLWSQIRNDRKSTNIYYSEIKIKVKDLLNKNFKELTKEEFLSFTIEYPNVLLQKNSVLDGLNNVYLTYRASEFDEFQDNADKKLIRKKLGAPPWEVLNKILNEVSFPYKSNSPVNSKFLDPYEFKLISDDKDLEISPSDLSSGEKVILSMVMWLYKSDHFSILPKLLLLDEPDASLHPSLTRQFLDAIRNVLVNEYGIRVIMTTHSPSTVALVPDSSIFKMNKQEPRIVRISNKWEAVSILTSGIITVGPETKYVFVEDEEDQKFMELVWDILKKPNPLSDENGLISPNPTLVFVPASKGRPSGGKEMVSEWVNLFQGTHMHGIIDADYANESTNRLHCLGRYEIENYLLDPLVVYTHLVGKKKEPQIPGINIKIGDERKMKDLSAKEMQKIIDYMLGKLKPELVSNSVLKNDSENKLKVEYINDISVLYPEWFIRNKGKKFMNSYMETFSKSINLENLYLAFERISLIPKDLKVTFEKIQKA